MYVCDICCNLYVDDWSLDVSIEEGDDAATDFVEVSKDSDVNE